MKTYIHSIELINIILKHGFIEITDKRHPEFWEYLKADKGKDYSCDSYKRSFKKGRIEILLNRRTTLYFGNIAMNSINENELKSFLFFTELEYKDKLLLKKNHVKPHQIYEWLESEKKYFPMMRKNQIAKVLDLKSKFEKFIL